MNYLLVVEYDGLNYNGWQIQNRMARAGYFNENNDADKSVSTIESEIINAVKIVTGYPVKLFVSGRTDRGVHALNQVANFKIPFYYDLDRLKLSLNGVLPKDISVKNIEIVHDSFHSTYDAISKTYLYKINSGFKSPLLSGRSWFVRDKLNQELMNAAADVFKGRNNFINFAKREKRKKPDSYYRDVRDIIIHPVNYGFDIFVEGEGFLRNMVRRIVGAIIGCGTGKINAEYISDMLEKENQCSNTYNAPPYGLFLYSVTYKHKIYY